MKASVPIAAVMVVAALAAGCQSSSHGAKRQGPAAAAAPAPAPPVSTPPPAPAPPPLQEVSPPPTEAESVGAGGPQTIQEDALESCERARELLDAGQAEEALAAIDRAYELLLSLPENGEGNSLQVREDIRRLITGLLVRVYKVQRAARTPMTSLDLSLAIVDNEQVRREIASFCGGERAYFVEAYRRSGLFRPMILAKLEAAGLPSQLSWLPLVESLFKERAMSRAAAVGLWQFIASTGQRYGLARNAWVDERLDPERSTEAAIAYLTELHDLFGDWPKALAAYNCGEAQVQRLQGRNATEYQDFWDLYAMLPQETRRYVPRFFATLVILGDPARYGMALPETMPGRPELVAVKVARAVQLDRLDAELGLPAGSLRELNPALRHGATPPQPYGLKVPVGAAETVAERIASLPEWQPPRPLTVSHRVGRGETLSTIAARYGTSIEAIMRANRIRSAHRIWPGQRLDIPVRGAVSTPGAPAARVATAAPADRDAATYTVRSGDTLSTIARRHHTTVERLRQLNTLTSDDLTPGQQLRLRPEPAAAGSPQGQAAVAAPPVRQESAAPAPPPPQDNQAPTTYQVRPGDTPARIAEAHHVALAALLAANKLTARSTIYPGQWLVMPR